MIVYFASENYPRAGSLTPPIPTQMPVQLLQELGHSCIEGDLERFRRSLDTSFIGSDSHDSNTFHLSGVMSQAIKLGRTCFVKELLRHGLTILPAYAYEAIKTNQKDVLEVFLENGWDINQPMGPLHPPVLR